MTPRDFCYWLQGFFEIGNPENLSAEQISEIKNHLQLVFKKETPVRQESYPTPIPCIYNPEFPTKVWSGPNSMTNVNSAFLYDPNSTDVVYHIQGSC